MQLEPVYNWFFQGVIMGEDENFCRKKKPAFCHPFTGRKIG
jgi:hypothetical protein